jgi:hypothetical protein
LVDVPIVRYIKQKMGLVLMSPHGSRSISITITDLKPNESEMPGEPSGSPSNMKWTELNKSNRMIMPQRLIAANNKAQS